MNSNEDRNKSRDCHVDPEDRLKAISRLTARARVEGPEVLLKPLRHVYSWEQATPALRNLAIQTVLGFLGSGWAFSALDSWTCLLVFKEQLSEIRIERTYRLATFLHHDTGMEFQLLPGGRANGGRILVQPFLVARWPVTERQFDAGASRPRCSSMPQTRLSWDECKLWLETFKMDIPSPVQWEYACRAATTTNYYWGDGPDPAHMWTRENAVEAMDPSINDGKQNWNAFGLVDTIGNVWELVGGGDSGDFHRRLGLSYRSQRDMTPYHSSLTRTLKRDDTGFRPVINLPVKIRANC
ncbi:MAG: SUMF1/EgtB/PvdO family nonheme iron enzyme [Planctomycetota bacterium]|nr:SUMF1/EgtB/PvdO family nonheme iron enzyme [Planctomycetota bacterium]